MTEMQFMNLSRLLRLQREITEKQMDAINRLVEAVVKLSESKENVSKCE